MGSQEIRHGPLDRGLLEQIRRQATDPSLPRLIAWLAEAIDGHAALRGSGGEVLAQSSETAWTLLPPAVHEALPRLATGELMSAVVDEGDLKARLLAIGPDAPHAVLAAARSEPYSTQMAEVVSHVADLIALLLPGARAAAAERRVREATMTVHTAIVQMLVGGQVALARRSAAVLTPGLLTDSIRLYLVSCPPGFRDDTAHAITSAIADTSASRHENSGPRKQAPAGALVAPSPHKDSQLAVIVPADHTPSAPERHSRVDSILRAVIKDRESHYLGISQTTDVSRATEAHRGATYALNVAHHVPERVWQFNGHAQIADVVASGAHRWAASLLSPLLDTPHIERDELVNTIRVALGFPAAEAAKTLDVHRNTVTGRIKRAGDLLQLNLNDVHARAVLDLALQIDAKAQARPAASPPILQESLSFPEVRAWAERFLAPLARDGRDLHRTLLTWLPHNTNADTAAAELGVHPQTVRGHLRSAEQLLQRTLLAGSAGAHDVVIALFVTGDIKALPGVGARPTSRSSSPSPAHGARILTLPWKQHSDDELTVGCAGG
ncbi:helix-turn-helix domain-containing protein [Actinacidiphila acididurans]|uniref:Helix-turn-helix domain-containing protein n=1 Tax=Actinacidiphila acididurans TaxID=2784346 RepID=A0ABS2TPM9_9ACTN|nr:helix-turn-helix domain-containing protein [Actinacidiphila acididurans]MBM9505293.1 helix-turn-helix domain-containing protein [Actinacidiphila acididurans]